MPETNVNITQKKLFLKRFWWIGLIIGLVLILSVVGYIIVRSGQSSEIKDKAEDAFGTGFSWPSSDAKYITAVPVDLTQIQSISKYRSCAGHIRDGYNFDQVQEYDRSMKHYLYPVPEFRGTFDQVKVFAPFDGTVLWVMLEADKEVPGREHPGNGLALGTFIDENVQFVFGHIYFVRELEVGDSVVAGELLGYAALGETGNDFDIDLTGGRSSEDVEVLGSAFDHMTPEVLAEFAKYGVTPENTKVTKEYRDANLCNYPNVDESHRGMNNEDWVQLIH